MSKSAKTKSTEKAGVPKKTPKKVAPPKVMTPTEFKAEVDRLAGAHDGDPEACHDRTDKLMESVLVSLGYEDGVRTIRGLERWYS